MEGQVQTDSRLLSVEDLKSYLYTETGVVKAVDGVSLVVHKGETIALVGESGCGKSMTALSILKLFPEGIGRIESGKVLYDGSDLTKLSEVEMRRIRGNEISMIFQDPQSSLNPVLRIGDQVSEVLTLHKGMSRRDAWKRAEELLDGVKIPLAKARLYNHPHELSGGMRQRVMIAMALACEPKLLIADEPTTALDVTIQAQVLHILRELQGTGAAILLITHNLGIVAEMCSRVYVMYAGRVVEEATVTDFFREPKHPYSKGLLACLPLLDKEVERLTPIEGQPPDLSKLQAGCHYYDRCPSRMEKCGAEYPPAFASDRSLVKCWLFESKD